ncbi:hypothetical protein PROAA_1060019 [Candidatus Propionivibrio aalborgensis]|uniref:Uncharacterized protein n=1 Tax=Candidatus Propionivibrio aalborgensis TaxID=1860101 RepID=A0A1A8XFG1_9RHOO|nr:hypothetical protein PROAA_1060019 [Candidatus Propionivibrio aalborgensis]
MYNLLNKYNNLKNACQLLNGGLRDDGFFGLASSTCTVRNSIDSNQAPVLRVTKGGSPGSAGEALGVWHSRACPS